MKPLDCVIIAAVAVWFVLAVRSIIRHRGVCSCGNGTHGCSGCSMGGGTHGCSGCFMNGGEAVCSADGCGGPMNNDKSTV